LASWSGWKCTACSDGGGVGKADSIAEVSESLLLLLAATEGRGREGSGFCGSGLLLLLVLLLLLLVVVEPAGCLRMVPFARAPGMFSFLFLLEKKKVYGRI